MAISPENDPHPSWTFFPPSATYIPSTAQSTSPASSPTSSPSPLRRTSLPDSGSINSLRNNVSNKDAVPSSTPSTHHRILDHCFHLSIETRLKQAEAQYLASTQEQAVEQQDGHQAPMSALKQDDWRRRQRTLVDEAVVLGRKGSNVEAIVDGILKSHRSNGPLQTLPRHLKHRLHLCQLTSMVFGRFDIASSTNNTAGLNIYSTFHSRRHGASRAAIQQHLTSNPQGPRIRAFFAQQSIPSSSYCRRHHRKDCQRTCCTLTKMQLQQQQALEQKKKTNSSHLYMNQQNNYSARKPEQQRVAGLVDAIPAFLKCSAMSYTDITKCMVERGEIKELKDTHVLEGWYRLLLEMMTQAVIEAYLCDGTIGVDTILDVFSYGNDPEASTEEIKDVPTNPGRKGSAASIEDLQLHQQQSESSDGNAQDQEDDILFVKSPEYEAFRNAKEKRLQELLTLEATSMEQHFVNLAVKYPLIVFERQMTHYITRSQKLLVDPKLSRSAEEIGLVIPPATSAYADGSLSMPVSDDEDDEVMEDFNRLEEIKEEDEDTLSIKVEEHSSPRLESPSQTESPTQPQRVRHEKMKLATITTSMEDVVPPSKIKNPYENAHHLPSPPPSVTVSRSSTVSPLTSTASLSEEDESIAEAARILMSHNGSKSKKHRYSDARSESESLENDSAAERLGHAVKKIRV
ncbi:hypothetical protein BGX34_008483 [Mortierella sp. NVP85]|nr:hypothetical protein BGX34_008483 [Mortierella sp. NVP85]